MTSTLTTSHSNHSRRKRYILIGGEVRRGKTYEYVSPRALARLYGLRSRDCHLMSTDEDRLWMRGYTQEYLDGLIKLRPREDGRYKESLREVELRGGVL